MAVTLGTLTIDQLTAQPVGYDGADVLNGLSYRVWEVSGFLRPADWLDLLNLYEGWSASRMADADTLVSMDVGTTVAFSGAFAGYTWSNVQCWFSEAPKGSPAGAYIAASFKLTDADQFLAAIVRGLEVATEIGDASSPDYGTITLGSATLTLIEQPDGYAVGPQVERTAAGSIRVSGPAGFVRSKRITGITDLTGWAQLRSWYETQAKLKPTAGTLYPVTPPEMKQEVVYLSGAKTTRCVVSLELWEV